MSASFHVLQNKWTLWGHLPHDTEWDITSYKKICTISSVEEMIAITNSLPPALVRTCMLFLMKEGINPMWEDPNNRMGGCFSYKIHNKNVYDVWMNMSYLLGGETLSNNDGFINSITGITISPKKNFCILKLWMKNCTYQNVSVINAEIKNLSTQGCIFKKHTPEY